MYCSLSLFPRHYHYLLTLNDSSASQRKSLEVVLPKDSLKTVLDYEFVTETFS